MSSKLKGAFAGKKAASARGHGAADQITKGPNKLLADTLATAIASGAAVMFGATRDGNTLIITLLDGDTRERVYTETVDDYRQALTDLAASTAPDDDLAF